MRPNARLSPLLAPLTGLVLGVLLSPVWSQEPTAQASPSEAAPPADTWLTGYFLDPKPEELPAKIRAWSKEGLLRDESARQTFIGFLSQVYRQNRERVAEWQAGFVDLPPEDRQTLQLALLFSRTSEADAVLTEENGKEFEKPEVPKILEVPLTQLPAFDLLLGFYFATGSENALARLVSCFNFLAIGERPPNVPEGYTPYYEILPSKAYWALSGLAAENESLKKSLETMAASGGLTELEQKHVGQILEELGK